MLKRADQKEKLRGVYAATYTPATPNGMDVDYDKLREHVRFIIDEGDWSIGNGLLMVAGGAGEGYMLSQDQWRKTVKVFAEEAAGKLATIAGVFALSASVAIEQIKYAESLGIDFIQLAPPVNQGGADDEKYRFLKLIDDAVSKIGIFLYHTHWNMPGDYEMSLPLLEKLTDLDCLVAIKWSAKNLHLFRTAILALRDKVAFTDNSKWVVATGENSLGFSMFMGPPANWDPKGLAEAVRLWNGGDYEGFKKINSRLNAPKTAVVQASGEELYGRNKLPSRWYPPALNFVHSLGEGTVNKGIMQTLGNPLGPPFEPQYRLSDEGIARAREILDTIGAQTEEGFA